MKRLALLLLVLIVGLAIADPVLQLGTVTFDSVYVKVFAGVVADTYPELLGDTWQLVPKWYLDSVVGGGLGTDANAFHHDDADDSTFDLFLSLVTGDSSRWSVLRGRSGKLTMRDTVLLPLTAYLGAVNPDSKLVTKYYVLTHGSIDSIYAGTFMIPGWLLAGDTAKVDTSQTWPLAANSGLLQGKDTTALWNAKLLQGKDTTALWDAKTLQGQDTTALWNAKTLRGRDTTDFDNAKLLQSQDTGALRALYDSVDYAIYAETSNFALNAGGDSVMYADSAGYADAAGNALLLQGKDTTALWNAKTLQGVDTTYIFSKDGGGGDSSWVWAAIDSASGNVAQFTRGRFPTLNAKTQMFQTRDTQRMFIDSLGRVTVGNFTTVTGSPLTVYSPESTVAAMNIIAPKDCEFTMWYTDAANNGPWLSGARSRGTWLSPAKVEDGDYIFTIQGKPHKGTAWTTAGQLRLEVDGATSSGVRPASRWVFCTDTNGSSTTPERMRIDAYGRVQIDTTAPRGTAKLTVKGNVNADSFIGPLSGKATTAGTADTTAGGAARATLAAGASLLQGKDTTALWDAKTLRGRDTTDFDNAKLLQGQDTAALRALYDSVKYADSAGVAKAGIPNFTVTTTTAGEGAILGNAFVGNWISSNAYTTFTHKDVVNKANNYGFIQNSSGETWFNGAGAVNFNIGASNKMILYSDRFTSGIPVAVCSSATRSTEKLFVKGNSRTSDTSFAAYFSGNGSLLTSLNGDALPAMSATKKGGVPATGTPANKFLRDDATWQDVGGAATDQQARDTATAALRFAERDSLLALSRGAPYDSATIAANSYLLQGKDTTALWNAKTLQTKDTTALWDAKILRGRDTTDFDNAKLLQGKDTTALWDAKTLQGKDTTAVKTFVLTGKAATAGTADSAIDVPDSIDAIVTQVTRVRVDSLTGTALQATRIRPGTLYGATLSGNFLGGDSVGNVTVMQATRMRPGTLYGATLSGNFLGGDSVGNVTVVQATRLRGALTGNVTGNVTGNLTGTADSTVHLPDSINDNAAVVSAARLRGHVMPRCTTIANPASITPNADVFDQYCVTGQAQTLTINAPTGTPVAGQKLLIRIKDDDTSRTLSWNAIYVAFTGITLSTSTTLGKTMYWGAVYNATDTKWDVLASNVAP